jgi:hypothetical protein
MREDVLMELQHLLSTSQWSANEETPTLQSAARSTNRLEREFEKGVRAIVMASGGNRLEISHLTVVRLSAHDDVSELVDWFLREAEFLMREADEQEGEVLRHIFGAF